MSSIELLVITNLVLLGAYTYRAVQMLITDILTLGGYLASPQHDTPATLSLMFWLYLPIGVMIIRGDALTLGEVGWSLFASFIGLNVIHELFLYFSPVVGSTAPFFQKISQFCRLQIPYVMFVVAGIWYNNAIEPVMKQCIERM